VSDEIRVWFEQEVSWMDLFAEGPTFLDALPEDFDARATAFCQKLAEGEWEEGSLEYALVGEVFDEEGTSD
jgi:hypothetical protein